MELVIFDCDGVLVDSELLANFVIAETLSEMGYEITCEDAAKRFAGVSMTTLTNTVEAELNRPLPKDFDGRVKAGILRKYRTDLQAIEGAFEVLSKMATMKCVASSSSPARLALGLVETELFELLYPHIFSTVLVERGKPHPDLFLYAAKEMGVDASECLVVEDSFAGVTAARAAGMKTIGFVGGSHCGPDHSSMLIEAGADRIVNDLRLLL